MNPTRGSHGGAYAANMVHHQRPAMTATGRASGSVNRSSSLDSVRYVSVTSVVR
jgi:hypothetical protein